MYFKTFSVGTTNIFPASNSKAGGQLLTEFNLRSRESVCTDPNVKYMIGPSYTHGDSDFVVSKQTDGSSTVISNYVLQISEGKALINGHYVESLAPMTIDLADANAKAKQLGLAPLKGKLSVGLRIMYSTVATMAGSIVPENGDNYFEGVQVVVLPPYTGGTVPSDGSQLVLPSDAPDEPEKVTAHLRLADFNYINGAISTIVNNVDKCKMLPASRIQGVDTLISNSYVTKTGLNPHRLYTYSGKATDPETDSKDTWRDSTDSMMVWDKDFAGKITTTEPDLTGPEFSADVSGKISLRIPHKQVPDMKDGKGNTAYYAPVAIGLPVAQFSAGTAGTVDSKYTNHIKSIERKLNQFYQGCSGKQVAYLANLEVGDELPTINQKHWNVGDYVLVNVDNTQNTSEDSVRAPSTIYVVLPGVVSAIKFIDETVDTVDIPNKKELSGVCLATEQTTSAVDTSSADTINEILGIPDASYCGTVSQDYFVIEYTESVDESTSKVHRYYFTVSAAQQKIYSDAVYLTGEIPLAQEDVIGGFVNVPDTALDAGYVYLDEYGHLRLLDYSLLRSGTLAYQLAEDFEVPSGLDTDGIQENLDEYVNQRVAFRDDTSDTSVENPYVIDVTVTLPESDEASSNSITIQGLDSRFNTAVCLHIKGSATSTTTVNIMDCEKLRIDPSIEGSPTINVYRCNLYYDATVLDTVNTIQDLSLWYEKFTEDDPDLIVDGMTVTEVNSPITPDDIDIWSDEVPNDNHFSYALRSLTFSSSGAVVGCEMYIRNETTANVEEQEYIIVSDFELPNGSGLWYPSSRLTRQLKITGSFITTYPTQNPDGYKLISTEFSALTQTVDDYAQDRNLSGTISLFMKVKFIDRVYGISAGTAIDPWSTNSFHVFKGTAIG